MIDIFVFDFDGLILDTESPFFLAWQEIYREHGCHVSPGEWASWLGTSPDPQQPYLSLERHLGRPVDRQALHRRRIRREHELLAAQQAAPGFKRFAHSARARGLRLGVASSSDRAWVLGHLDRLGLRSLFASIKCAEDAPATKPSPDLYRAVLQELNGEASQAVAFEDSIHGIHAAKAAGLYCVAIPNPITRHLDLHDADMLASGFDMLTVECIVAAAGRSGSASMPK
jgi:HAD superfamily hydrolase (TIGR01509 family)